MRANAIRLAWPSLVVASRRDVSLLITKQVKLNSLNRSRAVTAERKKIPTPSQTPDGQRRSASLLPFTGMQTENGCLLSAAIARRRAFVIVRPCIGPKTVDVATLDLLN